MRFLTATWLAAWLLMPGMLFGAVADTPHPRLWMTKADEAEIRKKIEQDPLAAALQKQLLADADAILEARTCRHEIVDGRRLLAESKLALHNISTCAWAWRFSGKEEYRLRVIREMEAACGMKDWNPSHFLDTAEMSLAVGLGYDWLYETLTPEQRQYFAGELIKKGLRPAEKANKARAHWTRPHNNWAQVCGGGIGLAAIAVAEDDEALTSDLLEKAVRLMEKCHDFYRPDGMYPEGSGYWRYGTNYHVMLLSACERLGVEYAEDKILDQAGQAIMHLTGPTLVSFNFSDTRAILEVPSPAQCWIASHFPDPVQAAHVRRLFEAALNEPGRERHNSQLWPFALMWLPPDPGQADMPTTGLFTGEQSVASFRTSWNRDATWFAMKGGTPNSGHGHMDVGSFVYEAHGMRWFHDLGGDNYNLPGYFKEKRWNYYRLQNRSHNTLEIAGKLQNPKAAPSPLMTSSSDGGTESANFDLTNAYAGSARRVVRSVNFVSATGAVRLTDEIEEPKGDVVWRAFTDAETTIEGDLVVLQKDCKRITLRNSSGADTWSIGSAAPPTEPEMQNDGFVTVTLTVPKADRITLIVDFLP